MKIKEKSSFRKQREKLNNKYRLVIQNVNTYEEKIVILLSKMNVFVILCLFTTFIILITYLLLAYTPLKEFFIPAYPTLEVRKANIDTALKIDSLQSVLNDNKLYVNNLHKIISGNSFEKELSLRNNKDSLKNKKMILKKIEKNKNDSILRELIETEQHFSLNYDFQKKQDFNANLINNALFFKPIEGIIINKYNPSKRHFGIDIISSKNRAVKAVMGGTVIFSEYTFETGFVIHVQHKNNLISIYKHNEILNKHMGDKIKAGEILSFLGNSGEYTSGPHLHFEIWYRGNPINPEKYIIY